MVILALTSTEDDLELEGLSLVRTPLMMSTPFGPGATAPVLEKDRTA
jgi:hypothetical protein